MTDKELYVLRKLAAEGRTTDEIMAAVKCCRLTALKYLKMNGFERVAKRIDGEKLDRLLLCGEHPEEAARAVGCAESHARRRKRALGLTNPCQRISNGHGETVPYEPFIPIRDRLEMAVKAKAKAIGVPADWIRNTWIPVHPEFMENYQGIL